MKKCPQCNSVYPDDLAFCLQDGVSLISDEEQPTVVLPPTSKIKQGVSPIFAYLTIGLLALFIGGGVVAWIMSRTDSMKANGNIENSQNLQPKNSIAEKSPTPAPTPETKLPLLTKESVENLLASWRSAQNERNFNAYKSCYDVSFRGIKRTVSGSISNYNYSQWMNDRQKMMSRAKYMNVRVDRLQISIQGETATAEFDQYFSTTGYADFGPKVLKIEMTDKGAKIVYEELKSATVLTN